MWRLLGEKSKEIASSDYFPLLCCTLIQDGDTLLLEWLLDFFPKKLEMMGLLLLEKAASVGELSMLQKLSKFLPDASILKTNYTKRRDSLFKGAAAAGRVDSLEWLRKNTLSSDYFKGCELVATRSARSNVLS